MPGPPLRAGLFSRYADGVVALRQQLMSSAIGDTNDADLPADFYERSYTSGRQVKCPRKAGNTTGSNTGGKSNDQRRNS